MRLPAAALAICLLGSCGHETPAEQVKAESAAAEQVAEAPPPPIAAARAPAAAEPPPEGMITIPAGFFMMGTPAALGHPEDHPMHEVALAAFDLDRTEVTTRAYLACVEAGACRRPHEDSAYCNTDKRAPPDRGDHPVNCVDWHQAAAHCAFAGKRLPTEREWEYAARGGGEQRRYSWGAEDPTPEIACYDHLGTCPVGSFKPGAFGLHDMSGNVWEWTHTWFGAYPDPPKTGTVRVYRGGSWSRRFPHWLDTALRNRLPPDRWTASLGFRCARSRLPLVCPEDTEPRGEGCARVRGTPRCEPGYAWNGEACTLGGGPTPRRGFDPPPGSRWGLRPQTPGPAGPAPDQEPITRTRTPEHDGDCQSRYQGKPAAYRFSGATFHARNRPIDAAGCTRRNMGATWTSACCPG